jgi:hypothetical protein
MTPKARSVVTVALVFAFYLISMLYFLTDEYNGNYSGFLHISAERLNKNPLIKNRPEILNQLITVTDGGYDGQLFYFMAYDPFLTAFTDVTKYRDVVDLPPYRYRRIGFSLLTHLFALGNPQHYPAVMMWLILMSHIVGSIFLVKIPIALNRDPLWGLLYILIPGFSFSLMYGLPESLAGALLLAGFYFHLKRKMLLASLTFAASLLFRETGILLIGFVGLMEAIRSRKLRDASILWISVLPYFIWRLYITVKLLPDYGWKGFFSEPPYLAVPPGGILELFATIARGEYPGYIVPAGILFPVLLTGAACLGIWAIREKITSPALALVSYSFLALSLTFEKVWVHISNAERLCFEMFLCLILVFFMNSNPRFRKASIVYFAVLFFFDFLLSSADRSFRAGIHWIL